MDLNILQHAKRAFRLSELKALATEARRARIFKAALREYVENPWAALNADSDVLGRLVEGWGNPSWSANDEYLSAIIDEFARTDGPVLECGSGLSTIVLGTLASITDRSVCTLENDSMWAQRVQGVLNELGLKSVQVCVGRLKHYGDFEWYDPPLDAMPSNFSLVICDGPPGDGYGGRSGFLPVMRPRLDDRVSILLDDIAREDEKIVAREWVRTLHADVEKLGKKHQYAVIRTGLSTQWPDMEDGSTLPSVTVGIPAFNSGATVGRSIDSVLGQTHSNLQLLVSDNHSEDDTRDECLQRVVSDSRSRYFCQSRNIGVFENYNELFRKCNTKYFKWQSSSDWCDPDALRACIEILNSNPDVVLVCPHVWLADEEGKLSAYEEDFGLQMQDPAERFSYLCDNIHLCNLFNGVMRAEMLRETRLNQSFHGSDVVLLAELALRGKFVLLEERLWYRQMTPSSASKLQSDEQRARFFSGASSAVSRRVTWKVMFALLSAVRRSDNDIGVKIRCLRYLLRRLIWVRGKLIRELFS